MKGKTSLKNIKIFNTRAVLECILKNKKVSRIEISEILDLSPSTVGQSVSNLLNQGIIIETSEGQSTGGRKPIMLEIKPDFGCVVIFEIKRSDISAKVYDMSGKIIGNEQIRNEIITGNKLLDILSEYILNIQNNEKLYPDKVIGIGLLYQDDIPDYELNVEYTTSISTDIIRLDMALTTRCGVPVKRELINRYTLDYYLKKVELQYSDYAYVNLGERITVSFVLNNTLVRKGKDSIFDISKAVLNNDDLYKSNRSSSKSELKAQEIALKRMPSRTLADKLVEILKSALIFFPINNIFIGGKRDNIDEIVGFMSSKNQLGSKVSRIDFESNNTEKVFANKIIFENFKDYILN